ncbi:exodeoxyribonuclease VII small subunit [Patescibacteria group bacterium]|nr:exodeoxyribonuclease VII small subunit [Patescibacteria group bacterium]
MSENKVDLSKNLKKLEEISSWFENQKELNVEEGLKKVKEALGLVKESKKELQNVKNEFEEIEKEFEEEK